MESGGTRSRGSSPRLRDLLLEIGSLSDLLTVGAGAQAREPITAGSAAWQWGQTTM